MFGPWTKDSTEGGYTMKTIRSIAKIIKRLLLLLVCLVLLLLLLCAGYNVLDRKNDRKPVAPYGEKVTVQGRSMNVMIQGQGPQTLVLLPGYGTAAPALDFKGLADALREEYRVIVVEPFGYGLSDVVETNRTIEAMTEELHECLQALGVQEYILGGHSIAGIYGLYYIQRYGDEVKGYVGLDTSVPYQINGADIPTWLYPLLRDSGVYRALVRLAPQGLAQPWLTEAENRQLVQTTLANLGNWDILSEGRLFKANLAKVQELRYPDELPVLFLLASESAEAHDFWVAEHEAMTENLVQGRVVVLDGPHYIHHGHEETIRQELAAFFG